MVDFLDNFITFQTVQCHERRFARQATFLAGTVFVANLIFMAIREESKLRPTSPICRSLSGLLGIELCG
jgi:hypothetical protein